jgi:hypothetical protein
MLKYLIATAALVLAGVPAAVGLAGNDSFSRDVPVRVPEQAQTVTPAPTPAASVDDDGTADQGRGDVEPGDDRGGDVPRDDRTEAGDDRGDHAEPGDDNGGDRPRDARTEAGDDRDGTSGHDGSDDSSGPSGDDRSGSNSDSDDSGSGTSGGGSDDGPDHD